MSLEEESKLVAFQENLQFHILRPLFENFVQFLILIRLHAIQNYRLTIIVRIHC